MIVFMKQMPSLNNPKGIPEFLGPGRKNWTLHARPWTLDPELLTLNPGPWMLGSERWILDAER